MFREFSTARTAPLARTRSLEAVISKYEADHERATLIADARRVLAAEAYPDQHETLAVFRLRAGLSQAQLAEKAGTSQSHIARIERGQNDPSTDVVVRIAEALGVDASQAFEGVRAHRESASQTS